MKKRNLITLLACLLIIISLVFHFFIFKNENALFLIAAGLDKPSKLYNIVIERIYSLSQSQNLDEEIRKHLEQNKNDHLYNLYIHVLGIIGDRSSAGIFIKLYSRYQHDLNHRSTVNRLIDAMGLIDNNDLVPFLETLLRDYDQLRVQTTKYSIARSLYLITGNKSSYVRITRELSEARNVILNSKGRKRTLQEMLLLDKLYRPPEE